MDEFKIDDGEINMVNLMDIILCNVWYTKLVVIN
jgi:hypothetical protein